MAVLLCGSPPIGPGRSTQGNASITVLTDIPLIPHQQMGEKATTEAAKVLENLVQVGKEEQFNKPGNSKGLMLGEGLLVEKISRGGFVWRCKSYSLKNG